MAFEGANGPFGCIASIDMWWYKLEHAVVVSDGLSKGGADFVVHGVQVRGLVSVFEASIDGLVCANAVCILFGGKGVHQDSIAGAVQGDHEVLVATTGSGVEAPCVICIQLCEWYIKQGESWCCALGVGDRGSGLGLGRTYVLSWLCHVAKVCFTRIRAVATNQFGSEAWSGGVGTRFMADSQVDLTGYPAVACRYAMRAGMLGRS